ncbi:mucin-2-like [Scylla paramamosain]|uniref:mucin-2-like n=1 Tax=Scylla paramamosain TaxID=85552 RepID=UPI003083B98D
MSRPSLAEIAKRRQESRFKARDRLPSPPSSPRIRISRPSRPQSRERPTQSNSPALSFRYRTREHSRYGVSTATTFTTVTPELASTTATPEPSSTTAIPEASSNTTTTTTTTITTTTAAPEDPLELHFKPKRPTKLQRFTREPSSTSTTTAATPTVTTTQGNFRVTSFFATTPTTTREPDDAFPTRTTEAPKRPVKDNKLRWNKFRFHSTISSASNRPTRFERRPPTGFTTATTSTAPEEAPSEVMNERKIDIATLLREAGIQEVSHQHRPRPRLPFLERPTVPRQGIGLSPSVGESVRNERQTKDKTKGKTTTQEGQEEGFTDTLPEDTTILPLEDGAGEETAKDEVVTTQNFPEETETVLLEEEQATTVLFPVVPETTLKPKESSPTTTTITYTTTTTTTENPAPQPPAESSATSPDELPPTLPSVEDPSSVPLEADIVDIEYLETEPELPVYDITVGTSVMTAGHAQHSPVGVGQVIPVDLKPEDFVGHPEAKKPAVPSETHQNDTEGDAEENTTKTLETFLPGDAVQPDHQTKPEGDADIKATEEETTMPETTVAEETLPVEHRVVEDETELNTTQDLDTVDKTSTTPSPGSSFLGALFNILTRPDRPRTERPARLPSRTRPDNFRNERPGRPDRPGRPARPGNRPRPGHRRPGGIPRPGRRPFRPSLRPDELEQPTDEEEEPQSEVGPFRPPQQPRPDGPEQPTGEEEGPESEVRPFRPPPRPRPETPKQPTLEELVPNEAEPKEGSDLLNSENAEKPKPDELALEDSKPDQSRPEQTEPEEKDPNEAGLEDHLGPEKEEPDQPEVADHPRPFRTRPPPRHPFRTRTRPTGRPEFIPPRFRFTSPSPNKEDEEEVVEKVEDKETEITTEEEKEEPVSEFRPSLPPPTSPPPPPPPPPPPSSLSPVEEPKDPIIRPPLFIPPPSRTEAPLLSPIIPTFLHGAEKETKLPGIAPIALFDLPDPIHTPTRRPFIPPQPAPRPQQPATIEGLPSEPVLEGGFLGIQDEGDRVQPTFELTDDYDNEGEPTLPPSLPNLKIIPFVAADALTRPHNTFSTDDLRSTSRPLLPPFLIPGRDQEDDTATNLKPEDVTDKPTTTTTPITTTTTTTPSTTTDLPTTAPRRTLPHRPPVLPPRRPGSEEASSRRPFLPFRRPGERPSRPPFAVPPSSTTEEQESEGSTSRPDLLFALRDHQASRPPFIPPRRTTADITGITAEPSRATPLFTLPPRQTPPPPPPPTRPPPPPSRPPPLPISSFLPRPKPTTLLPTQTPRPIVPNEIPNLLLPDVFGLSGAQGGSRFTASQGTPKPIVPLKLPPRLPEIPDSVKDQLPLATDPILASGLLKLSGCNIYGRMHKVKDKIPELSGKCKECRCTPVGVQCLPTC